MSEQYCKLDQRIVYSSIWDEDGDTCKIWITLLALKDVHTGIVDKNITGIARLCNLPLERVEAAFAKFQSPDTKSSSQEFEGRRIKKVDTGWLILNHERYTEIGWSNEKKEYERQRKAEYRKRATIPAPSLPNPDPKSLAPSITRKLPIGVRIPDALAESVEFCVWWAKWLDHLKGKRSSPSTHAQELQLKKLEGMGTIRAITALKHSIESNWKGIYEPGGFNNNTPSLPLDNGNSNDVRSYL